VSVYHCDLAWLGGEAVVADVVIETGGDRILRVTPGVAAPERAERLPGVTLPGLANAHSHAFQRAIRGRTQRGIGSFWTWREQMYACAERIHPDRYHRLARAVYGEMALAGITAVGEFHYLHHGPGGRRYDRPNAMGEALVAAAAEAGVRMTLLDACYLDAGIGIDLDPTQRRFADGDAGAWAARAEGLTGLVSEVCRVGAAVHSVRAVDPASIAVAAMWAAAHGVPLHAHVSEQPAENEMCRVAYGATPTRVLRDAGAVTERFTAVHATHVTAEDITLLGAAGASVCLCPTTERDLGDGIGPARALREAGAMLALGSDSQAVIDLLEEARALEMDERLATGRRGNHDAASLLRAATSDGHRAIGWPEAGRIEAGAFADLVTVDRMSVRTAGVGADDALEMLVFAASAADVRHVVVGGRVVVRDGAHAAIDVASELASAIDDIWRAR
jgi:formiminoglutamate deiminase